MRKVYKVTKGVSDNHQFAWQLTCNGRHVQWFANEDIARYTCDKLNAQSILEEVRKINGEDT